MILTKEVEITISPSNFKRLTDLGHKNLEVGKKITIPVEHLSKGNHVEIDAKCDNVECGELKKVKYFVYLKNIKNHNIYTCSQKCAYDAGKHQKTKFKNHGDENYNNGKQIHETWENKSKKEIKNIVKKRKQTKKKNREMGIIDNNKRKDNFKNIDDKDFILIKKKIINKRTIKFFFCEKTKNVYVKDPNYIGYKKINIDSNTQYRYYIERNGKTQEIRIGITQLYGKIIKITNNFNYLNNIKNFRNIWDDKLVIKYLTSKYENMLPYNHLSQFKNGSPENSIYGYLKRKGGLKYYLDLFKKYNLTNKIIYVCPYSGKFIRTNPEFIFACFLHFNNIKYQYEPKKINTCLPDFYIPSLKLYIEIVGYRDDNKGKLSKIYHQRLRNKKILYKKSKINVLYLTIIRDPFKKCKEELPKIFNKKFKTPNIIDYLIKYTYYNNKLINELKEIGKNYMSGKWSCRYINNKKSYFYGIITKQYGSLFGFCETYIKMKDLDNSIVALPNRYCNKEKNVIKWLEYYKKNYDTKLLSSSYINKKRNSFKLLRLIYIKYGTKEFKEGGKFYGYIEYYMHPEKYQSKTINNRKQINQYDLKGNFIKTWNYIKEASKKLNVGSSNISYACNGKRRSSGGFIWKYN